MTATSVLTKRHFPQTAIVFLVSFLPRMILVLFFSPALRTPIDELSTIAIGAYVGGKDWSTLVSQAGYYYGGGFTILFAPLFRLFSDPILIYHIMLTVCSLLQSMAAVIAYHVMYRYFKVTDTRVCTLASIAISYTQIIRTTMVYNEHMLILMVWTLILLLCRLVQNSGGKKQRLIDTVLLMLALSYCLTLHTRAKAFWIAVFLIVLLYRVFYGRFLLSVVPAVLTGGAGYFAAKCFIRWCKATIWLWHEGEFLRNSEVALQITPSLLKNPIAWKSWLSIVVGQVHISTIFTGGLTAILIPVTICFALRSCKTVWDTRKSTAEREGGATPQLLVVLAFSLMFIGAMILAQSFTWLPRLTEALEENPYGGNQLGLKALTYIRYYVLTLGPLIAAGIAVIWHDRGIVRKMVGAALPLFLSLQAVFVCFLLPHMTSSTYNTPVYMPFALTAETDTGAKVYLAGILVCTLCFAVFLLCLLRKKLLPVLILLCLLMPYQYMYNGIVNDQTRSSSLRSASDASVELLQSICGEEDFPDVIYMLSSVAKTCTFQYAMPDVTVSHGLPDPLPEEGFILTYKSDQKKLLNAGYICKKIARREYIYIKGETCLRLAKKAGLKVE